MTRGDWLLLLVEHDGDDDGLDPIRIQKGLFLLSQEGGLPAAERYRFVPYNYGPMSPRVYRDVDVLVRRGLLERRVVGGRSWRRVRATRHGHERAHALRANAGGREAAAIVRLREIRRLIDGLDFTRLLETIYERYPDYASRSVFRRQ
jgi:uncharacterized protein YwgA